MSAIDGIVGRSNTAPDAVRLPAGGVNRGKQTMDGQMFMQLLISQLRAQDPTSPMDTNAMMTQTTQLASMEQLTSLTTVTQETFSLQMRMAAANLVGKQISYVDAQGTQQQGLASAVSYATSVPTVTVAGTAIRLDAVLGVATTR